MFRAGKVSVVLGLLALQVALAFRSGPPSIKKPRRPIPLGNELNAPSETSVEVIEGEMIWTSRFSIVGRRTAQSSTLREYTSDKAADGNKETNLYPNFMCACTKKQADPWWRVNLGEERCVKSVSILNRGDCCNERLTNAVIRVGANSKVTCNKACGSPVTSEEAGVPGGTVEKTCNYPLVARYVGVEIPSETPVHLQLCEVTVTVVPLHQCPKPAPLSIVGQPTAQSTTFLQYTSDKAADGNMETNLYPNFMCTHTEGQANPWWRVDLGGEHCIESVTILNRGECCSDRLTNAAIRVGTSTTVTDNQACGSPVTSEEASRLGDTVERGCPTRSATRYVSVDIPSETPISLQLCEVTVKELPMDQCI